jgi:hypothetical protein
MRATVTEAVAGTKALASAQDGPKPARRRRRA